MPVHPVNRALHANFFRWLEHGDAALSKRAHDDQQVKPYTVSGLRRDPNGAVGFRVTLLDDALLPALQRGMKNAGTWVDAKEKEHPYWVDLLNSIYPCESAPDVLHLSYEQLAQQAEVNAGKHARTRVRLRFDSPTSFRRSGMHYPLPDPALVFASYCARWNAFAPEALHIAPHWLEWLGKMVGISDLDLQMSEVQLERDYKQIGVVGEVVYEVAGKSGLPDGSAQLQALADYAQFCGTGHKTTQGMGQTRRVS